MFYCCYQFNLYVKHNQFLFLVKILTEKSDIWQIEWSPILVWIMENWTVGHIDIFTRNHRKTELYMEDSFILLYRKDCFRQREVLGTNWEICLLTSQRVTCMMGIDFLMTIDPTQSFQFLHICH